ncbi:MAG: hypothetical protein COA79_20405 [Planctomycetota bacterium]|nr:MAG: hypothetical protein COA79_20405 [Planctomycetota bacterium]
MTIPTPQAKHIPYFVILVLLVVVAFQCNSGSKVDPIDTKIEEKRALIETHRTIIETLTKEKEHRDSRIEQEEIITLQERQKNKAKRKIAFLKVTNGIALVVAAVLAIVFLI